MVDREVKQTRKNKDGDITLLCNPMALWSPKRKDFAILEIEENIHRYFVKIENEKVYINVVYDPLKGKYMRTDPDKTQKNNLDDLPDC